MKALKKNIAEINKEISEEWHEIERKIWYGR